MAGVRVAHRFKRSQVHVVPVLDQPLPRPWEDCNHCALPHPCKTVHLWLEPDGTAIVSTGVLETLRRSGMHDLRVVGEVKRPPPLTIHGKPRHVQDQQNRALVSVGRGIT